MVVGAPEVESLMKKVLVTGAAGFIGYHLSERLLEEGNKVTGIDNLNSYYDVRLKKARLGRLIKRRRFRFHKADLADIKKTRVIFKAEAPDLVVHLAAQAGVRYSLENPRAYLKSNITGFLNVLEACRQFKIRRLIYASSSSVYGANTRLPFSVQDRTDAPLSLYGATKKSNELMAHAYGHLFKLQTTGLRFFTVYGPWGRPDMAYFLFTRNLLTGKPIQVFNRGNMRRDFTYIDDIVDGMISVTRLSKARPFYNLGSSKPVKLMDCIRLLEKYTRQKAKIRYAPMHPGDILETSADIRAARDDFGFFPKTNMKEGVKKFVDWYKGYYRVKTV